ncbi:hypothetical protein CCR80_09165 [Rhodothalassium salexigens]|uniref:DUF192 domain-containing protein n=1 Tax=Rhodothalassium salexigens TaxID=1086 RepID=UPI00191155FC|nr:DUF192 domain-containing protein [Rhodothalassium salexigens]MBK5921200.1 hypothetical protein [Rhodothalassium salexigens]
MRLVSLLIVATFVACALLPGADAQPGNPDWHIRTATPQDLPTEPLLIDSGDETVRLAVALADDPGERRVGLMFRSDMAADEGMLFDFARVQQVSMWMKNTFIPLDMLFIRPDGTIESIAANTTPLSLDSVSSAGPVLAVLELNAGAAQRLGLEPGDRLRHGVFGTAAGDAHD